MNDDDLPVPRDRTTSRRAIAGSAPSATQLAVAVIALIAPARRATRVDPNRVLRAD